MSQKDACLECQSWWEKASVKYVFYTQCIYELVTTRDLIQLCYIKYKPNLENLILYSFIKDV